jgi:hypothetical protein
VKRLLRERLLKCYFVEIYLMLLCEGEYIHCYFVYVKYICRVCDVVDIFKAAILERIYLKQLCVEENMFVNIVLKKICLSGCREANIFGGYFVHLV